MAWAWRRFDVRESRVARRNLEIVYPDLLPGQRDELHAAILRTTNRRHAQAIAFPSARSQDQGRRPMKAAAW